MPGQARWQRHGWQRRQHGSSGSRAWQLAAAMAWHRVWHRGWGGLPDHSLTYIYIV